MLSFLNLNLNLNFNLNLNLFGCRMIDFFKRLFNETLALAAPPRCLGCGADCATGFCDLCAPQLRRLTPPICLKCGLEMPAGVSGNRPSCSWCDPKKFKFDACRSALRYSGPIERVVKRFKYKRIPTLSEPLSRFMTGYLEERAELFTVYREADMVVPVPLHWMRRLRRGFNQSELLAAPVAAALHLPMVRAIRRIKNNIPQSRLGLKDRRENVKGIFTPHPRVSIQGRRIVLIDDVMTSGSTVAECAAVLKKAGAAWVGIFTTCRRVMM